MRNTRNKSKCVLHVMCSSAVVLGCTMAACVIVGLWNILNTKLEKLVARLQHSMMDVFMELLLVTHNHRAEEPLTGKQFVDCGRLTSQRHDTLRTNPQSEHRAQGHKEARAIAQASQDARVAVWCECALCGLNISPTYI